MNALPFAEFKIGFMAKIADQDSPYDAARLKQIEEKLTTELKRYLWREHRMRVQEPGVKMKCLRHGSE